MYAPLSTQAELRPTGNVVRVGNIYQSNSKKPWLVVDFRPQVPAGRWVTLTYQTSFLDPLIRPLLRLEGEQTRDILMPAPLFGVGTWTGLIPKDTRKVLISPTEREGRFGFTLDSCVLRTRCGLITQALLNAPIETYTGLRAQLSSAAEAQQFLERAHQHHTFAHYDKWRSRHLRELDVRGLDTPRHDWSSGVHIRYVSAVRNPSEITTALQKLHAQPYPYWSVVIISDAPRENLISANNNNGSNWPIFYVNPDSPAKTLIEGLKAPILLGPLLPGSLIPTYTLSALAEHVAASPHQALIYGDEDRVTPTGIYHSPQLKPDWSPFFQQVGGYIGSAIYMRETALDAAPALTAADLASPLAVAGLFNKAKRDSVGHIRRVTLSLSGLKSHYPPAISALPEPVSKTTADGACSDRPLATIIIPNKDKPELLRTCLSGIGKVNLQDIEVIIVDNGSRDPKTWEIYKSAALDPRFRIMNAPGPFNFAQMCNDAAKLARAPALVFLNNDIELPDPSWLARLLRFVYVQSVGAIGAKLFYPSGRIQHGGMVVGLAGFAAHIDIGAQGNASGYLNRLRYTHEVSAVTGACLAIEKAKFDAVGGFDAVNFPVELNDVDLCLRLKEKGWTSLFLADCQLIHHESATRGWTRRPQDVYRKERSAFLSRWGSAIRDDPFFHPALSLSSVRTALA